MNETLPMQVCPWDQLEKTFGPANLKWCEQRICSIINEPINTWSNLPYLIIGLYILFLGLQKKDPKLSSFQIMFGTSTFFMGLFSFIYHATNNFLTQVLDFVGMYFYVFLLICSSLVLLKKVSIETATKLFIVLVVLSTAILPWANQKGLHYQNFILFIAIAIIILQFKIYKNNPETYPSKMMKWTILLFVTAKVFALLDSSRLICDPKSLVLQGHAWWHIVSSIGVLTSYFAFASQFKQFVRAKI